MNNIKANIVTISDEITTHQHDYAQIIIPLQSKVFIQTDFGNFTIDSNSLGFIPPSCIHDFSSNAGEKSLVIDIPMSMIKKTDLHKFKASSKVLREQRLSLLIQLILTEIELHPSSPSLKYLYFYLYDKIIERSVFNSIEYIHQHYQEDLNLNKLAEMEHYNVNYYSEWFKKQVGVNPKDYIQKLRIDQAKELLASTKYSITEIASQVGYQHSSSFCRVFKMLEAVSPTEFRKHHQD